VSSGFVEKKKKKKKRKQAKRGGGWVGRGVNSKWKRGAEILARCYQEWSKLNVCERMMREARFMLGRGCPPSLRSPNRHLRPPNGLTSSTASTTSTTSLSLVNEQPAHPAELAGKPPPEGTKVFEMELLKFGGLADIT